LNNYKCKFCAVTKKTKKSIENHMRYQHPQEYLQLNKDKKLKEENKRVIYSGGFDTDKIRTTKIAESDIENFKNYINSLPFLDNFYNNLSQILRQGDPFWFLPDLFFLHVNSYINPWKMDYLLGIITSIELDSYCLLNNKN
jgi:hypothetical protein